MNCLSDENVKYLLLANGISWKALLVLNCTNTLAGRGIFKDDDEVGGRHVTLPIHYFRNFYNQNTKQEIVKDTDKVEKTEAQTITHL